MLLVSARLWFDLQGYAVAGSAQKYLEPGHLLGL